MLAKVDHTMNKTKKLAGRTYATLTALLLPMLVFSSLTWGQDELKMDGMGNIHHDPNEASSPAGKLYQQRCAHCHDNPTGRVPPRASLRYRPPEGIYQAMLSGGAMSAMASGLSDTQIKSLVKLLTGKEPKEIPDPNSNLCAKDSEPLKIADNDWTTTHGDNQGRRFRQLPAFNAESVNRMKLKWSYAIPGGAKGPAVLAGNSLFIAGTGYLVALNADSGCVKWTYPTNGRTVRAVTVATHSDRSLSPSVVFGDDAGTVFALDAATGDERWQTNVESHVQGRITAAPTVHKGVVYVPISSMEDPLTHNKSYFCCSARGGIAAIDLKSGKQLWKKTHITGPLIALAKPSAEKGPIYGTEHAEGYFEQGPAGGSTYTPLTIDESRGVVYASTAEEYGFTGAAGPYSVIAYKLKTGERVWQQSLMVSPSERRRICDSRETDCRNIFSMGTSVLIHPLSKTKTILLVGDKAGRVHALDPDSDGRRLWSTQVSEGGDLGGVMYGLASDQDKIYVPVSDVDSPEGRFTGSLVALDPATGIIVWRAAAPKPACNWDKKHCIGGQVAAVTVVSDMVFTGFWDGYVRIYDTRDGRLLKEIDTAIEFPATNGTASGGQVSGYPVTVGNNALYINSGASSIMKSGNALLVYSVDGK